VAHKQKRCASTNSAGHMRCWHWCCTAVLHNGCTGLTFCEFNCCSCCGDVTTKCRGTVRPRDAAWSENVPLWSSSAVVPADSVQHLQRCKLQCRRCVIMWMLDAVQGFIERVAESSMLFKA
jgi:hypothetical protein